MNKNEYIAVGRRKSAIARVRLRPGTGKIIVNKRPLEEYFGRETSQMIVKQPLEAIKISNAYDIVAVSYTHLTLPTKRIV